MAEIFGRNPILEVLRSGADINRITVARGVRHSVIDEIFALAKASGVPINLVERKVLDRQFPGQNHQGVAAFLAEAGYVSVDEVLSIARSAGEAPLIVVCDGIEDPHNLGAILRNADAFGAHGVIIPKRRSAALSEGTMKASAGAGQHVSVARVGNIAQTLESLKNEGLWICGTDAEATSMYDTELTLPLAVVIGNESRGMGNLVRKRCDLTISIPCGGHLGSLNASVASGIILCEIRRQRGCG